MTQLQLGNCLVVLINTDSVFHLWSRSGVSAESIPKQEALCIFQVLCVSNIAL